MKINLSNMSKKSKTIAATAFILGAAAVGAGSLGLNPALADTTTAAGMDQRAAHITDLVTALSQKFNLNSSDVQAVIDTVMTTERTQKEATEVQNQATRLAKAVAAGKITQAQSDLIKAKAQETKTFMESLKGKAAADRQSAMKTYMASLKTWAAANNIPKGFEGGFDGLRMRGHGMAGGKGHGGFGEKGAGEKTASAIAAQ
jgi:hypothetical protein